jgi:hypothetical protein
MSWVYVCPKCRGLLNPDQTLILLGENRGRRMLVGFHPEPGNYEIYFPEQAVLEEGDAWDFFCPICQADLVTEENENLCAVTMLEGNMSRRVMFSRIYGEQATYVMYDRQLEHRHGTHAETYVQHLAPIRTTEQEQEKEKEEEEKEEE